jgi:hypothetical protein
MNLRLRHVSHMRMTRKSEPLLKKRDRVFCLSLFIFLPECALRLYNHPMVAIWVIEIKPPDS